MELLMDDRESEIRREWVKEHYPKLNPTTTHLEVGDYHYILKDGTRVVFEYKTGKDFLSSITDTRLHNQVYALATTYDWHFIMVCVKSWNEVFNYFKYRAGVEYDMDTVIGAIASFNTKTTVIVMNNLNNCFDMMLRQARKIEKEKVLAPKTPRKDKNPAVNYLMGLHGISDETVKSIIDEFNPTSLQDLLHLTKEDLMSIDGIANKKSEMILGKIHGET